MDLPAPNPPRFQRLILRTLAGVALVVAWLGMKDISDSDPWPANANMDIHNLADALALNQNLIPAIIDQPGLTQKYLLALDYRVRHFAEILPVWNLKKLRGSADPLAELRDLEHISRAHSRMLVLLFILGGATLVWTGTRSVESASLAVILLGGSSGLLYHGLLSRPDLLCVLFGGVLGLLGVWRATTDQRTPGNFRWLLLAGLGGGFAVLTKLPGLYYLGTAWVWCWLAAGTAPAVTAPVSRKEILRGALLSVASAGLALLLAYQFTKQGQPLTAVASLRLRVAAALVAGLPWLVFAAGRNRPAAFLAGRARELALLGAGALATLPLSYLALRVVLSEAQATAYLSRVAQLVLDPGPLLHALLPPSNLGAEFLKCLKESPFVFAGAVGALATVLVLRSIPWSRKIFALLLLLNAAGMTVLLCRYYFLDQFTIYAQVPLLLVWPCLLCELGLWRANPAPTGIHWAAPLVIIAAATLLVTGWFRLRQKYDAGHPAGRPLAGEPTLTFLFDHGAHPAEYRQLMLDRYHSRDEFTRTLERFLADPATRY